MTNYNYLIVGQGIAGTMLAYFLMKRGRQVLVADNYNPSSSSNIAAGLINPITGKRFVKTWKAEFIFPFAEQAYFELKEMLGEQFYFRNNIIRAFSEADDFNLIINKSKNPDFVEFIIPSSENKQPKEIEIKDSGYVDMAKLIKSFRDKLLKENLLIESLVKHEDLVFEGEKIYWNNHSFDRVIYCEGYKASLNPFFSWLPFVLSKGELLIIHCPGFKQEKIWMREVFVLPLGNDFYKVGSTYQWDTLDELPTVAGRKELTGKLDNLLGCSYKIVEHLAGVRPTVKDRRPLIGMHPDYNNLGVFNGLGAKGASLAPFLANHFVEFLEDGRPLDKEVDIKRFLK